MRFFLVTFFLFVVLIGRAQHRHFITQEVLPSAALNKVFIKEGSFLNFKADYGLLLAPLNYQPRSKDWLQLPFFVVHSINQNPRYPIFLLHGGPGSPNDWSSHFPFYLLENHDLIILGYRGIESNIKLEFPGFDSTFVAQTVFDTTSFKVQIQKFTDQISQNSNFNYYSLENHANDLEEIRNFLQADTIGIFAYSFGGIIAQVYDQLFTKAEKRIVFIGSRPMQHFLPCPTKTDSTILEINKKYFSLFENALFEKLENQSYPGFDLEAQLGLFSFYYSQEGMKNLRTIVAGKNLTGKILHKAFYESFVKTKAMPDMVLKIGELAFVDSAGINRRITPGSSFFYWLSLFENRNLYCKLEPLHQKISDSKSLWIAGTLDIVSPPSLYIKYIKKYYPNSNLIEVANVLHGDLLNINSIDASQMECFFLQR